MKDKRRSKLLSIKDLTKEFYEKDKIKKGLSDITIYETWKKISDIKILERTKKVFTKGINYIFKSPQLLLEMS